MYAASFLLAPIGLHWAFRYLKVKDAKAKRLGIIIIILTILSISLTVGTFMKIANAYSNTLNNLNKVNSINDVGKMF